MAPQNDIFFVFADTSNMMCWHNLRFTRMISSSGISAVDTNPSFREAYLRGSANYAPYVPSSGRSCGFVSLFTVNVTSQYQVEYDAEFTRFHEFPTLPSRFSAIFAFGNEDDCRKAHELYRWDLSTLRRFRLIPNPLNRVHRANMEIISLMRSVYPRGSWSREEREAIWRHYWSGGGSLKVEIPIIRNDAFAREWFESGEIWEYLIEGHLELVE